MVSKEELRKLIKDELVDMVYDLLIRVDKLTFQVQGLKKKFKGSRHLNTVAAVLFLLLMTYSGSRIKACVKKEIRNQVCNPDTREKRF